MKVDRAISKSQKKSLKFCLDHLAHTTFPHPFKDISLPLIFQLTRLWGATVSTWVNGLSQAVSYLSSFCCCYLGSSEREESLQHDGNISLLMPVSQGKHAVHSLLSQTLLASADDVGTRYRYADLLLFGLKFSSCLTDETMAQAYWVCKVW